MTYLAAALVLCVVGVIAATPFTVVLMLFLGNAGRADLGFWDCLPAGFLLGALAAGARTS